MSEAVKPPEGAVAPPAKPAPPPAPPKPPMPAKPAAKAADTSRRGFLYATFCTWFGLAWVSFSAAMAGMTLGTLRFMFPNVLSEPPSKVKVGPPDAFEEGKVTERFKDQNIWVVHYKGKIYALSTTCTHLGCTPNWLEAAQKFKCPCHGSGFYITGVNFEGPAPRPLERWAISLGEDGQLVVDKSKKFQRELGQWDNPESYFSV
jgi:cytochrome b6-f complex iron-sulfur subunit